MRRRGRPAQAGGMHLVYAPLVLLFAAFVLYGGLVMPAMEIAESFRRRRS